MFTAFFTDQIGHNITMFNQYNIILRLKLSHLIQYLRKKNLYVRN